MISPEPLPTIKATKAVAGGHGKDGKAKAYVPMEYSVVEGLTSADL